MNDMTEREEIELLLPWYATGKLNSADAERVGNYLDTHPELASQIELIREELDGTIVVNEALGTPSAGALDRLVARIEAQYGPQSQNIGQNALMAWFSGLAAAFQAPAVRYAGIAAAVLIAVQAVVIGTQLTGGGSQFETASAPPEAVIAGKTGVTGTRFLIAFEPDAKAGDITKLLEDINATIISGPRGQGLYEVYVPKADLAPGKADQLVAQLAKRKTIIRFITISE
jgi:hypothetical protein